ncbi:MAG: tetratricopeptide repeat protein [Rhodospirillaceae bacterium]|nr:tetratricopeptide repeat protein [Rhodospirillaceae bacterium]MBT5456391.1 tetratricopeptide repeat protein [Rhodospirillaceae bacterium]
MRNNPDHPLGLEIQGTIALEDNKFVEAEAAFNRVLNLKPDNMKALAKMGVVRLRLGQTALGHEMLQKAYNGDKTNRYALLHLAPLEMSLGNIVKAVGHFRELVAAQEGAGNKLSPFHVRLAEIYNQQGQYHAARSLLAGKIDGDTSRAAQIETLRVLIVTLVGLKDGAAAETALRALAGHLAITDPRLAVPRAAVQNLKGDYRGAVETLQAVLAKSPEKYIALHRELARLHVVNGSLEKAARSYRTLLDAVSQGHEATTVLREFMDAAMQARKPQIVYGDVEKFATRFPGQPMIGIMLATLHAVKGDGHRALTQLSAVEKRHPDFPETYQLRARLLLGKGDRRGAMAAMRRATELSPRNIGYWVYRSEIAYRTGGYKRVKEIIGQALKFNPNNPDLLYDVALYDDEEGRKDAANRQFRTILKHSPDHLATLMVLAKNLAQSPATAKEAREYIGRAMQLQPDNPHITLEYGWILHLGGDHSAALSVLEGVQKQHRKNPLYFYRLAKIHKSRNRSGAASDAARKALSLGVRGTIASEMQSMIR